MNLEQARFNMVEQQVRTWDVLDQRVLDLMMFIPREQYVPQAFHALAFCDTNIPLGDGQVMMTPKLEARMVQSLQPKDTDKVLEVGTGSGFVTALLAALASHVVSVELNARLAQSARTTLDDHGVENTTVVNADAVHGWSEQAPYDAIAVTGSVPMLEDHFRNQLCVGGRLFVIVGEEPVMEATLTTRVSESQWKHESLFETVLPALVGARQPERFVL
jgi:protein-L-isoaspartate(D-aspartate) O-methyltransferase